MRLQEEFRWKIGERYFNPVLSISNPLSPESAAWYFRQDDYYLAEQGVWYGALAKDLKLTGMIEREDFVALLNGFDRGGEKLVASAGATDILDENGNVKKHGHRSGIDMTFSAPKSISILSYQDSRINGAFRAAVRRTLDHIEKEFSHTQIKDKERKVHAEKTDKMLWATFEHGTSRELDPQLHCHCVCMNITKNSEGKLKTVLNDPLYKNKIYMGQFFRLLLAEEIQKIGYAIEVTDRKKGFFEVRGVGEDLILAFSKRSQQVQERVQELRELEYRDIPQENLVSWVRENKKEYEGTADFENVIAAETNRLSKSSEKVYANYGEAELAAIAATDSRDRKRNVSKDTILELINNTCDSLNTSLSEIQNKAITERPMRYEHPSADDLILSAVDGLTEGQSTFSKHNLLTEAMRMGIGTHAYADFEKAFERLTSGGKIVVIGRVETHAGVKNVYSSRDMIDIESKVMEMCKTTKGTSGINVDREVTDRFIDHTDITLKMEVTLQIGEKDREKAEVKFKKFLSKIDDKDVRDRLTSLREQALKAKENHSLPKVIAEDHPELHQYFEKGGYGFTPGQKDAVRLIVSTKDRFSVIQGDAGTGKSFSMLYAKQLLEQNGFLVRGLAPTGKAATGLGSSAEIASERCGTIDSFLLKYKNADVEKRNALFVKDKEVWVVDEAGMCGSRKILDLMKMADDVGAKVVFVGDRKQFASIEAGRMFSELQDKAGVDMVIMPDVMRQKTQQTKDIVKAISLKEIDFAFGVMQGYREVGEDFKKIKNESYSIGNIIRFNYDYKKIPANASCKITSLGAKKVDLEYFDEDKRVYQKVSLDMRTIRSEDFSVFDPPMNQNPLSRYKVKEFIEVMIPEQGLPACRAEIISISNSHLRLAYTDPLDNSIHQIEFDPAKNPSNIKHFFENGSEKKYSSKDAYVDMITVESDKEKCLSMVANDYLESVSARKDTLLITGTNKDKDALNTLIRPELVKQGLIKESKPCEVFRTKSLAGAGAMSADSYQRGQVIVTNNTCGPIPRGTQAEIQSFNRTKNTITVQYWDKEKRDYVTGDIDVRKDCKKFSTYDKIKREFGVGDRIIFLKNDKKVVGVNNGEIGKITSIDNEGNVKAVLLDSEPKREVEFNINNKGSRAFNYIDHAYAITDYKSQGATTQRLLWYAPTDAGPLSSNSFYVAITRCKEEVGVYTDNAEALKEKVKSEQQKESTLDYLGVPRPVKQEKHAFIEAYNLISQKIISHLRSFEKKGFGVDRLKEKPPKTKKISTDIDR
jgi:conjugative relaxase-like TrwC/TraI family protein